MAENKKLIVAFLPASNCGLSFRGSEEAMYQYANFNETLLGNKSIICLKNGAFNEPLVLKKFKKRFDTFIYFNDSSDLEKQLSDQKVDALYTIRYGKREEPMLSNIPMLVHAVYDMSDEYGIMAGVSKSVADKFEKKSFVPHIVSLEEDDQNYRKLLGIPESAIVFGRHGGADTWDLPFVKEIVLKFLDVRDDIYFLFAVRPLIFKDISHPRLICLDVFTDPKVKRRFINTCDAMIHAQSLGETFGLSVAEFSMANKPVITWDGGRMKEHLRILGEKAVRYKDPTEIAQIISAFRRNDYAGKNWRAYDDYSPEKVMAQFKKEFLDKLPSK